MSRQVLADLETLEVLWKQSKNIKTQASQYFERQSDPYSYALDLMFNASDFSRSKANSIAYSVMLAFNEWSKKIVSYPITLELKDRAVDMVLKQKCQSLIELVFKIFRVKENARHFINAVEKLLLEQKFNEAFYCAVALDLQEEFTLDQIVLPLIFKDKKELAIEYVKGYPAMQLELVTILDSACLEREAVEDLVSSLKVKDFRKCRLDQKWLQKVLWTILNKCEISLEKCPNLHQLKSKGALKYLMYKKYIEQSISMNSWEELVIDGVDDDPVLKKELLMHLICYNDSATALKMATKLNIPFEQWPEALKDFAEHKNGGTQVSDKAESWDEEIESSAETFDYLTLEINSSDIHLIDTTEQFVDCLTNIIENYDVVGVDAEWKPAFGIASEKLSLLQLGVSDKVFLIDFISLSSHLQDTHFDLLLTNFFSNSSILKIGYGIKTDLKILMKYCHGKGPKLQHTSILDIGLFYEALLKKYPEIIPAVKDTTFKIPETESVKGLSRLCQVVLGKPLRKCEQFSHWEKRPLRDTQIVYAALDAYCLLQIYEALCNRMLQMGLKAIATVADFLHGKWNVPVVKRKGRKAVEKLLKSGNQPSTSSALPKAPVIIKNFKVVVDNMLQGLGRYLRIYGADVVILENVDEHTEAVKVALAEERIILSSGAPFRQLKGHVPQDMCLCVPETLDAKQQAKYVFQHFNIEVTEEYIFSRCSICNGDELLEIPSDRLMLLWLKYSPSCSSSQGKAELRGGLYDKYCAKMKPGISIQLQNLTSNVFSRVKDFLVCIKCGKVYWEGSHHDRIKSSFSNFVPSREEEENDNEEISGQSSQLNDQRMEKRNLVDSDVVPGSSSHEIFNDLTSGSVSNCPQKDEEDASHVNCPRDFRVRNIQSTVMHFEECSSDDDCDLIVFNS